MEQRAIKGAIAIMIVLGWIKTTNPDPAMAAEEDQMGSNLTTKTKLTESPKRTCKKT